MDESKVKSLPPHGIWLFAIECVVCGIFVLRELARAVTPVAQGLLEYYHQRDLHSEACRVAIDHVGYWAALLAGGLAVWGLLLVILPIALWQGRRWAWFNTVGLWLAIFALAFILAPDRWGHLLIGLIIFLGPLLTIRVRAHCHLPAVIESKHWNAILFVFLVYLGGAEAAKRIAQGTSASTEILKTLHCNLGKG